MLATQINYGVERSSEEKDQKCVRDLRLTDPRYDKNRIEETKGGLLEDSYRWILENSDFQRWRDNEQSRLLWIKGDPGKGKTMLVCGIINELNKSVAKTHQLSYFFCQAADSRINNATAVLRGLLYLLIDQQPPLVSHIRKKHDRAGKSLFEDVNAWHALSEIFTNTLQDPSLRSTYLIIDALDECVTDLPKLLGFIVQKSSVSSRVKWIISSRNDAYIEQRLRLDDSRARLSLELKENAEQVSRAVNAYIDHCLLELTAIQHDELLRRSVRQEIQRKANGTFLWVSLVIKELNEAMDWEVLQILKDIPTELEDVYRRMVEQIKQLRRQYPELCRQVISTVLATYRPLHLQELHVLSSLPTQVQNVNQATAAIVKMCGSFLTIREDNVYIIHQSAREFLSERARDDLVPCGVGNAHQSLFSRSLQVMSRTLQRDMYSLCALGYPAEQIQPPDPDPLAASRYSCIYWIDHLCDWNPSPSAEDKVDLEDGGAVDSFLRQRYLYWLEALSLCKSMSKGVASIAKLEVFMQGRTDARALNELVRDARRFIMSHKLAIENAPLQTYVSALVFSPTESLVRDLFKKEEPDWITIKPTMNDQWSPCVQTLEGQNDFVQSIAFSHDSVQLASAGGTVVKIWDASTGECLKTLEGHKDYVWTTVFSHDSTQLASGSLDNTVKIWNASAKTCSRTLTGHSKSVNSVSFSHDSTRLASGSDDRTVKIWNVDSGKCIGTLDGHTGRVRSVVFSRDSARLASGSDDDTVKIWNVTSGACLQTLTGHRMNVYSVSFSHNSTKLASGSDDRTVKIWNVDSGECIGTLHNDDGILSVVFSPSDRLADWLALASRSSIQIWDVDRRECLQTFRGHSNLPTSVAFSHNSGQVASASRDETIKIWDTSCGKGPKTLAGHSAPVWSVVFSPDLARLASASGDGTVMIWDVASGNCIQTLHRHDGFGTLLTFSHDSSWLASMRTTIKIWDSTTGRCIHTLRGHGSPVQSVSISHDSILLASASGKTIKIWRVKSGESLHTLDGHSDRVTSVVFSHNSARLASASIDETAKLWDTSNGACLHTFERENNWTIRVGTCLSISSVAFSHDSAWLASAADKKVKVWDTSSGTCLLTLDIGTILTGISFDSKHPYLLHSEIGTIDVSFLLDSATSSRNLGPYKPIYQGMGLSPHSKWLTNYSKNQVWIPPEYRRTSSVVSGNTIGIGAGSGRVWIC
ncbi:beta transducin-like protein HET-D2Y, partial [Lentithecium fluviatile CBS 122367]